MLLKNGSESGNWTSFVRLGSSPLQRAWKMNPGVKSTRWLIREKAGNRTSSHSVRSKPSDVENELRSSFVTLLGSASLKKSESAGAMSDATNCRRSNGKGEIYCLDMISFGFQERNGYLH